MNPPCISVLPTATPPSSSPTFNNSAIVPIGNGVYSCFAIPSAVPTIVPEPFPVSSSIITVPTVPITSSAITTEDVSSSFARRQEATTDTFTSASPTTVISATSTASSVSDTALPTYVCVPIPQATATGTDTVTPISSTFATATATDISSSFASVSAF
ncbi:hypothetical protein BDN71DRAFT_236914 [Pleurotus eryngii]|uniref:Uncharacterized protein n=1 Tax=Pleurotus eryngii TaxID=5323 RepID=A0A9P6DC16_PLEER|nr:hypothetical protein BDN71DRAFT_236914 [Pleurotus eryngii]